MCNSRLHLEYPIQEGHTCCTKYLKHSFSMNNRKDMHCFWHWKHVAKLKTCGNIACVMFLGGGGVKESVYVKWDIAFAIKIALDLSESSFESIIVPQQ